MQYLTVWSGMHTVLTSKDIQGDLRSNTSLRLMTAKLLCDTLKFKMLACPSGTVFFVRMIYERCPYISGTLSARLKNVVPDWQESSVAIPTHYGSVVGSPKDADTFKEQVNNDIEVLIKMEY